MTIKSKNAELVKNSSETTDPPSQPGEQLPPKQLRTQSDGKPNIEIKS